MIGSHCNMPYFLLYTIGSKKSLKFDCVLYVIKMVKMKSACSPWGAEHKEQD